MSETRGFTLMEVLIAVAIFALLGTAILELVTRATYAQSVTNEESLALALAEERMREVRTQLDGEEAMEDGVDSGEFEDPEGWAWQVSVDSFALALPDDYEGEEAPSAIFAPPAGARPEASGEPPAVRRIEVRVVAPSWDLEQAKPLVTYAVELPETPPPTAASAGADEGARAGETTGPEANPPGRDGVEDAP